jgi:hypothetical protein
MIEQTELFGLLPLSRADVVVVSDEISAQRECQKEYMLS